MKQLEAKYGPMTITKGSQHSYVGMDIIYNDNKTITIDMVDYVKETITEFPDNNGKLVLHQQLHVYLRLMRNVTSSVQRNPHYSTS